MVAQSCHASLGAILSCADHDVRTSHTDGVTISLIDNTADKLYDKHANPHPLREWLQGSFTKICVSVDSEQELIDIHQKAVDAGLINCLITDNGKTEFNGVKTLTCCAIGPAYSDDIDKITGHLKLL